MKSMSESEARRGLFEILDRVSGDEEITITRHGKAVAVVVHPDVLRRRRVGAGLAEADEIRVLLEQAGTKPLPRDGSISAEQGEHLLTELARHRGSHAAAR